MLSGPWEVRRQFLKRDPYVFSYSEWRRLDVVCGNKYGIGMITSTGLSPEFEVFAKLCAKLLPALWGVHISDLECSV